MSAFAGSLVSLIVVILMAKMRRRETIAKYRIESVQLNEIPSYTIRQLLRACAIYILILILLCSPLFPFIKEVVSQVVTTFNFPLSEGQVLKLKIDWIATPGVLIILATLLGGTIQSATLNTMLQVFGATVKQLKNAIATRQTVTRIVGTVAMTVSALAGLTTAPPI